MPQSEFMLRAKELIAAKRFDEAKSILSKVNTVQAKKWIAQIDSQ